MQYVAAVAGSLQAPLPAGVNGRRTDCQVGVRVQGDGLASMFL